MKTLILDIETEPAWDLIKRRWPWPGPVEFDPSTVAVGNLKDPKKITAKMDAAWAKHERAQKFAEPDHYTAILDGKKCLLNPALSRVCAVGTKVMPGYAEDICHGCQCNFRPEKESLAMLREQIDLAERVVGWNIKGFDLPYLDFRWRAVGIEPPMLRRGRYYDDRVVDLMEVAACCQYGNNISLKVAAPAFGFRDCPDADGGKDFWKLVDAEADTYDSDAAEAYLRWDVEAVAHILTKYPEAIGR